jgi:hypothetical protein
MGAISGALVAEALRASADDEPTGSWTSNGVAALEHAECFLRGDAPPLDLAVGESFAVAVGLSTGASPLLVDPATVELIDGVRSWLDDAESINWSTPELAQAAERARCDDSFEAIVAHADSDLVALLAGMLRGLERGIGAVPARLVSTIGNPDGRRGRRYVSRLVDRMLRLERNDWYDARTRRGPKEVLPGVWLSNIHALGAFTVDHPEGLVLSLCDIEGRLDNHPHQITFHLDDTPKRDANPELRAVIDEVLTEVDAARAAGQPVLVHCRHGASRTGLILRLLLVRDLGIDPDDALTEAQCLWPHTSTWNKAWAREIERRSDAAS